MEQISNYLDKGGVIFIALALLSIFSITIIIYKFTEIYFLSNLNLNKILKDPELYSDLDLLMSSLEDFPPKKRDTISEFINLARTLKAKKNIEEDIFIYVNNKFKDIQFMMPSLEIISQVSPLIGLLGTVIGMIDSFNELELGGSLVDPSILAGGIWTALLTTAMGLLVAIPALVAHYFFEKRISYLHESYSIFLFKVIKN
jgi:biopolymer transport protein ExbB